MSVNPQKRSRSPCGSQCISDRRIGNLRDFVENTAEINFLQSVQKNFYSRLGPGECLIPCRLSCQCNVRARQVPAGVRLLH